MIGPFWTAMCRPDIADRPAREVFDLMSDDPRERRWQVGAFSYLMKQINDARAETEVT